MALIAGRLREAYPGNQKLDVRVTPLSITSSAHERFAVCGLVLAPCCRCSIACANAGGLLSARALGGAASWPYAPPSGAGRVTAGPSAPGRERQPVGGGQLARRPAGVGLIALIAGLRAADAAANGGHRLGLTVGRRRASRRLVVVVLCGSSRRSSASQADAEHSLP